MIAVEKNDKKKLPRRILVKIVFAVIICGIIFLSDFFAAARRREASAVFNAMGNFEYVDHIKIISDSRTIFNTYDGDYSFDAVKSLLNPFRGHITGEDARTVRTLEVLSHKHLSIEYFIDDEMLFFVRVFMFYSRPEIETLGLFGVGKNFLIDRIIDGYHAVVFINCSNFMVVLEPSL